MTRRAAERMCRQECEWIEIYSHLKSHRFVSGRGIKELFFLTQPSSIHMALTDSLGLRGDGARVEGAGSGQHLGLQNIIELLTRKQLPGQHQIVDAFDS